MNTFKRYIGIDYSGAETSESSLSGLRVYIASANELPIEVKPPPSTRKYWTRRGLANWLVNELQKGVPTIVGIDHGFSFPLEYFDEYRIPHRWQFFLEDFKSNWPTDRENTYVDFVRKGVVGNGSARKGNARWKRLTETRAKGAKSVFHFDVPGSVAKSTHAGLPWLLFIKNELKDKVHFWPFDGWKPRNGTSVIAEVYPALWADQFQRDRRTNDQHDAYSIVSWLSKEDKEGTLSGYFLPRLTPHEQKRAEIEGWILGVESDRISNLVRQSAKQQRLVEPLTAIRHSPSDQPILNLRMLIKFFDDQSYGEGPIRNARHAASINAVLGEELALAVFSNYCEQRHWPIEILDGPVTTGFSTGPRLDRWIVITQCDQRIHFQAEIKNWTSYSLRGRPIPMNSGEVELRGQLKDAWSRRIDELGIPRDKEARKVLEPMRHDPAWVTKPLLIYWEPLNPKGALDPFIEVAMPVNCHFKRLSVFSASIHVRNLLSAGLEKINAPMPETLARMSILKDLVS